MCLIALAYRHQSRYPFIFAANRDEFHDRPTLPMHWWEEAPHILAGRDLKAGGTWAGISTEGRFAALTNHRDLRRPLKQGPSRGLIVRKALDGEPLPDTSSFEGFNLIHGHISHLYYHNNVNGDTRELQDGIHGLSNAFLDTPWPKVVRLKSEMEQICGGPDVRAEDLFAALANEDLAPDHELPDTGMGSEKERGLSAAFIRMMGYGTRCSTVILIDEGGRAQIEERTFAADGLVDTRSFSVLLIGELWR